MRRPFPSQALIRSRVLSTSQRLRRRQRLAVLPVEHPALWLDFRHLLCLVALRDPTPTEDGLVTAALVAHLELGSPVPLEEVLLRETP